MCAASCGMPRSDNRIVTWCRLSGDSDQKSHMAVGERRLVCGCALLRVDEVGELVAGRGRRTPACCCRPGPSCLPRCRTSARSRARRARRRRRRARRRRWRSAPASRSSCRRPRRLSARGVARDVVGDGERAVGARALGVHHALGDALAVQVRQLLDQLEVLQQQRAARAGGQRVLVVGDGRAGGGGEASYCLACGSTWWGLRGGYVQSGGEQPGTIAVK